MENNYWTAKDEKNGTCPFPRQRTHATVNRNDTSQIIVGTKHWVNICMEHTTKHNKMVRQIESDWIFAHGKNWKEKLLKKLSKTS